MWIRPFMDSFLLESFFSTNTIVRTEEAYEEQKNKYVYSLKLPSFKKKNISVKINNNYVEVSAKKNEYSDHFFGRNRNASQEKIYRSFEFGDDVDVEKIKAEYKNDRLTIEMPKLKREKEHKISIDGSTSYDASIVKSDRVGFLERVKTSIGNLLKRR